jgi:hypothetical protein
VKVTRRDCVVAYEFLASLAPIKSWKLPPSQDVEFRAHDLPHSVRLLELFSSWYILSVALWRRIAGQIASPFRAVPYLTESLTRQGADQPECHRIGDSAEGDWLALLSVQYW